MVIYKAIFILMVFSGGYGTSFAVPITTNTALPVSQKEIIVREKIVFSKAQDQQGPIGREAAGVSALTVIGYGVTPKLAAFFILPTQYKRLRTLAGDRDAFGIGDVSLFFRYTVYSKDAVGRTFRIAPFLGVKAPTGDDNKSDSLGLLPAPLQLGTGSWDVFGGLIVTYASVDWNLDVQSGFRVNTRHGGNKAGNLYRGDISFQYRLLPNKIDRATKGFFYGVIEANLIYQEKNTMNLLFDQNTGGTTLYIVPGIQYAVRRWVAELAVQIPVIQDLNGTALGRDFAIHTGLRLNF